MGNIISHQIPTRVGDEWKIEDDIGPMLSVQSGDNPAIPPISGWKFYNGITEKDEEDQNLTCDIPLASPPCCISVSLSGQAKDFQGECEGEYKDTGMSSSGWKVAN